MILYLVQVRGNSKLTEGRILSGIDKELAVKHEQLKRLRQFVEQKSKGIQKQIEEMMEDIQAVRKQR